MKVLLSARAAVVMSGLALAGFALPPSAGAGASSGSTTNLPATVAKRLGPDAMFSAGLRSWLAGGATGRKPAAAAAAATPSFGTNVDANNPSRDRLGGQSETAIAAQRSQTGERLVLAAWNDVSAYTTYDVTRRIGSATGVGISRDGGRHFTDLIGLPNSDPDQRWGGDPSVASLDDGVHFAVASLYYTGPDACADGLPAANTIAVTVATVHHDGVSFSSPVPISDPGDLCRFGAPDASPDLSVLDKDWVSYDPTSRTLALSYTRFFLTPPPPPPPPPPGAAVSSPRTGTRPHTGTGQIEVARATLPSDPTTLTAASFVAPAVVWPEEQYCPVPSESAGCGSDNSGAYVAVAPGGTAYIGWERNLFASHQFSSDTSVYIHIARLNAGASTPSIGGPSRPVVVSLGQPYANRNGGTKSVSNVRIAGYTGFANDFPRIAIDRPANKVLVEWNDASRQPLGDIWLRALPMDLTSLDRTVRVNDDNGFALHFLPALSVRRDGVVCSSWYDRRRGGATSTSMDYYGECRTSPTSQTTDFEITTGSTDWLGTSSDIWPNFGDYTDNATDGATTYFAWSDGRVGVPQPFVDSR